MQLAAAERQWGTEDPRTFTTLVTLGIRLNDAGFVNEAVKATRMAADGRAGVLGAQHDDTLLARSILVQCLQDAGQRRQAADEADIVLLECSHRYGADHPKTMEARYAMIPVLTRAGRLDEALMHTHVLLPFTVAQLGADHESVDRIVGFMVKFLNDAGRHHEAHQLQMAY